MLTGGLVVVLAVVFAYHQNPPRRATSVVAPLTDEQPVAPVPAPAAQSAVPSTPQQRPVAPTATTPLIAAGQAVYAERACARCHSIAGHGGARSALDGVGARLSDAEIRAWLTPAAGAEGFQARHANIDLTPTQRDALAAYLRSLR
jgi:mono/diheme cytochrome c family protein